MRSRVHEFNEFDYFNPFQTLPILEALPRYRSRLPVGVARQRANRPRVANNPPTRHIDAAWQRRVLRQTGGWWYTYAMPAQPSDGYDAAYGRAARHFLTWARKQHPAVWRQHLDAELSRRPPRARPTRSTEPVAPDLLQELSDSMKQPTGTIDARRAAFKADQEAKRKAKKEVQRQEALADNGLARRRAANLANIDKEREEIRQRLQGIRDEKIRRAAYYAAELGEPDPRA